MEMAQALKPLGVRPDHRRRGHARRRLAPDPPVRDARGLHATSAGCSPPPTGTRGAGRARAGPSHGAGERGRRPGQDRSTRSRTSRSRRWSATRRGSSACPAARATARWRRGSRRGPPGRRRGGPAPARGPSGRDRFRVELQRPYWRHDRRRNRLLAELAERLGVPCVATGNVHVHARERIPLQDAMVAVRLGATLDETEPRRRGNSSHVLAPPERMAERFREHPDAVEESGRLAERLRFDLTEDLGYRYPGSEDPEADRKLAELCRRAIEERYAGRRRREEALGRLEEELRVIRHLGLSGFFLLHRDLLELAREVAAEVRGPGVGAPAAAAGARAGVERVLDRLLPHRPLARGPDRERAVARALPERGAHRAAGHRPRLPARHPRRADPARARPLRARPLCARGRLLHLPGALGGARLRQGARACRRARSSGWPAPSTPGRTATTSRTTCPRTTPAGGARRAGTPSSGWRATPGGCPATSPSTPAGWSSRPSR